MTRVEILKRLSADEIFTLLIKEWGEKNQYLATEQEILILGIAAQQKVFNIDNGDGTFTHKVTFKKRCFIAVTSHKLDA